MKNTEVMIQLGRSPFPHFLSKHMLGPKSATLICTHHSNGLVYRCS